MLAATEQVTSPEWWQQVAAAVASAAAVVGAIAGALKWLPGVRTWWKKRQQARRDQRQNEHAEALQPVVDKLEGIERKVAERHEQNTHELDEVKRQLSAIHRRIDDHMLEERDERRKDQADMREWFIATLRIRGG